jgi:Fic family protein
MMQALVEDAGRFRRGSVGVFGEQGVVHLAPPAERVPMLMNDLFDWLKTSKDHLLIRSCVFHYEFEFIHPFIDGNGRTGRLWQSLILGKLHPMFEHLPVENMVYANQQERDKSDIDTMYVFYYNKEYTTVCHKKDDTWFIQEWEKGDPDDDALDLEIRKPVPEDLLKEVLKVYNA